MTTIEVKPYSLTEYELIFLIEFNLILFVHILIKLQMKELNLQQRKGIRNIEHNRY